MAPRYKLIDDFGGTNVSSTSPGWVIAIWRLALPLSFNRKTMRSVDAMPGDGVKLRGKNPLIIVGDCTQLTIQTSKESHNPSLSATLNHALVNYLVDVAPDDWCAAWIVNNEEDLQELIKKLQDGRPCNDRMSGLKFLGRVVSIGNGGSVDRSSGKVKSTFNLTAAGFQAFNNTVFYDVGLQESNIDQIAKWMAKMNKDLSAIFGNLDKSGKDNVVQILATMMEIILGSGFPEKGNKYGKNKNVRNTYPLTDVAEENGQEAKFANLVPEAIGKLLNRSSRSDKGGYLAYPDTMECIFGVQQYPGKDMYPSIKEDKDRTYKSTGEPLLGSFLPAGIVVMNKPLWSILTEYLNPLINEMYVTLRANKNGEILPTLIARQIPFTTDAFNPDSAGQGQGVPAKKFTFTKFLDLPRWVVAPSLVYSWYVGKSNATRTNLVHIYGQSRLQKGVNVTWQIISNKPIYDNIDIQRSGVKAFMGSTACEVSDQIGSAPTVWMQLIADRMMGSQFTANGTLVMPGIQAPICIGDNLEWNGIVYHIESVVHSCSIEGEGGRKSFTTEVSLTNGLRNLDDSNETSVSRLGTQDQSGDGLMGLGLDPEFTRNPDYPIYPGVSSEDNERYQPGVSSVNRFNVETPDDMDNDLMELKPDSGRRTGFGKPGGENIG